MFRQEYSFKPSTLAIELGSGESSEAVFEATRVAYRFNLILNLLYLDYVKVCCCLV